MSTEIVELIKMDESSHEEAVVIILTLFFEKNEENSVIEDDEGIPIEFSYTNKSVYDDYIRLIVSRRRIYSYFNNEKFK